MKFLRHVCVGVFVVTLFTFLSGAAYAIPSAEFTYIETNIGGGIWQYDYTLFNTSDPIVDAGFDLYEVFFQFNPLATLSVISLPTGWAEIGGSGFEITFSTTPGPPPLGNDIAPATFLAGFSFQFDYQAGNLPFEATFTNPVDPFNPVVYSGTSAPVPEPATALLLGTGLVTIAGFRRKLKKR